MSIKYLARNILSNYVEPLHILVVIYGGQHRCKQGLLRYICIIGGWVIFRVCSVIS